MKLCSVDVGRQLCSGLSFNPTNWRQLCTLSNDVLTLWNVGQLNRKYALMSRWVTSKFMVLSTSKLFLSSLLNIPFHFGAKLALTWEKSQHFVVKAHKFHTDKAREICFNPIRSTTLIWVVTRHQYGISVVVPQKSLSRETSGGITKNWLFSHANLSWN